jgi:hypothetical protein
MRVKIVCSFGLFLVLTSLVGCQGGSELEVEPVSGSVTLDGNPIDDGRIQFRSTEADQRSFSGVIKEGKYTLGTTTGPMRVEIRASRIIAGKFDESNPDEKIPMGEMYIPQKYNSRSELTADVPEGGKTIDFDLTKSK